MNIELKPCPFCGGQARFEIISRGSHGNVEGVNFKIRCQKCGAVKSNQTKGFEIIFDPNIPSGVNVVKDQREDAAAEWNERAGDNK